MKHTNTNGIFNETGKKVTAIFAAGALVVTGVTTAVISKSHGNSQNTYIGTTVEDPLNSLLVLTEDFDINDKEAVTARARAIYELSEKEYEVNDIMNLIYISAGKKENINYPQWASTDAKKFEYLRSLAVALGEILDDGTTEYVNAMEDETVTVEEKPFIYSYMFMPETNEAKELAINIANTCETQKDNIVNQDEDAKQNTANDYYGLYGEFKENEFSLADEMLLGKEFSSKNVMFTSLLTKKEAEEMDAVLGYITTATNETFSAAASDLDISEKLQVVQQNGNCGTELTPLGENYNSDYAKSAESYGKLGNSESTTKIADKGGNKVNSSTGKQEQLNEPTTSNKTETFVANVTEGKKEETIPGGTVVEVVPVPYEGTTSIFEVGGDVVEEKYVDADAALAEELGSTYTLG